MLIVLSQRIDFDSEYEDVPFVLYHYPKKYRNQIRPGDSFVYYQGDRYKRENRYYFGCGVIGDVFPDTTGNFYYAKILKGKRFQKSIPIYAPTGGFWESIDYDQVRKNPTPSWQNSIRKISKLAFDNILQAADMEETDFDFTANLETGANPIEVLKQLNDRYRGLKPQERNRKIAAHLDRGSSVTASLKILLGAQCQICGWKGFIKPDNKSYIEAHHITQIAERTTNSLCTENVILLCPNCHVEIHYGKNVRIIDDNDWIVIECTSNKTRIHKNKMKYLESLSRSSSKVAEKA